MGARRTEQREKCQKSGFCLASEFLHIIHGDLLQSVSTFPVMTSRLFLTAASFTDRGGSLEVGRGVGSPSGCRAGPTAKVMGAGRDLALSVGLFLFQGFLES